MHFINTDKNKRTENTGTYTITDLGVCPDDENYVCCSWVISEQATQLAGSLTFVIRFECIDESTGQVKYAWNTGAYNGVTIATGIYHKDTPSYTPQPAYNFVTTTNGDILKFFVGTSEEYAQLTPEEQSNLFAIITDDTTREEILAKMATIDGILNGDVTVERARKAVSAESATIATMDEKGYIFSASYARKDDLENGNIIPEKANIARNFETIIKSYETNEEGKISVSLEQGGLYLIACNSQLYGTSMVSNKNVMYNTSMFLYVSNKTTSVSSLALALDDVNQNIETIYCKYDSQKETLTCLLFDETAMYPKTDPPLKEASFSITKISTLLSSF